MRTAYEQLEVSPAASEDQIRAAYLGLIARYHPDRHAGHPLSGLAAERAAELNGAYRILSDPGRRAAYDEDLRVAATGASARSRGAPVSEAPVILVRALAIGVALILVLRAASLLWRLVVGLAQATREVLAGAAGTPLSLLLFLTAAGLGFWLLRKRRRQR